MTTENEIDDNDTFGNRLPDYGTSSFYGNIFNEDDRARTNFIKQVVNLIRRSQEYGRYRKYLLEHVELNSCSILSNLSDEEAVTAGLELHHYPLTLFDCVELALGEALQGGQIRVTTFALANHVLAAHWRGHVGLVPLTKTLHEAAHALQITLDPRSVYGNWQVYLDQHRMGLTEHLVDRLRAIIQSWQSDEVRQATMNALTVERLDQLRLPPTVATLLAAPQ